MRRRLVGKIGCRTIVATRACNDFRWQIVINTGLDGTYEDLFDPGQGIRLFREFRHLARAKHIDKLQKFLARVVANTPKRGRL